MRSRDSGGGYPLGSSAAGAAAARRRRAPRSRLLAALATGILALLLLTVGTLWRQLSSLRGGGNGEASSRSRRRPAFCKRPAPLICAHGGDTTGGAVANTAEAYAAALAHPAVTCVEVDVSRSSDAALVALHTRQLLQLSGNELQSVGEAPLARLVALRSPGGAAVMTFAQALAQLAGKGLAAITVDVKDGPPLGGAGFATAVAAAVRAAGCSECIVWSRDDGVVAELVAALGGRQAGFVLMNESEAARAAGMGSLQGRPRTARASATAAHWPLVDGALVGAARRRGVRVFGWTANEGRMADPLVLAGAHAIVTDHPAMVQARVAELRGATCGAG